MSCAGHLSTSRFELPPADARDLFEAAAASLHERIYAPSPRTVASLDRAAIEALLPAKMPETGGGAARLQEILDNEFLPLSRDYRHPLHLGHQRPAPSVASVFADFAAAAFNPSVTMFEGGPYAVAVEGRVLAWMKTLAGFSADAVATLVNGGAEATLTALMVARDQAVARGHAVDRMRILAGEHVHYSVARAGHILGLAPNALIHIATDAALAMDVADLRRQIEAVHASGDTVLAIVANAGSTANGAFDPLPPIADIAAAEGAWLHVDAAHGGAALLSDRHRHKLAGLARADSVVINPHKMFFVSAPCSALLCRHRADFAASLAIGLETASYVIPDPARLNEIADGDEPLRWTLACTRFFAAFRLYAALCAYGKEGLAARIEACCDLARDLHDHLATQPDFELLGRPAFNMICFRYRPRHLPGSALDSFNRQLRQRLAAGPDAYLTGCEAQGKYWLRAQIMSERVTRASLTQLIDILRREGAAIKREEGEDHVASAAE